MRINDKNSRTINFLVRATFEGRARKKRRVRMPDIQQIVKAAIEEYRVFKALSEIKAEGGLNYGLLRKDYGEAQIKELINKRPCLVAKKGHAKLDEIAQSNGFEDDEDLLNAIIETPPKQAIIKDIKSKMQKYQEELEWKAEGFEPTDGILPESLSQGDQIYMGGSYYIVCGYDDDFKLLILATSEGKIKVRPDEKLPCQAIKRKG